MRRKCVLHVRSFKTHQMSPVHATPKKSENETIAGHFAFVLEENSDKEITLLLIISVFEKLRFRDGLIWTVAA